MPKSVPIQPGTLIDLAVQLHRDQAVAPGVLAERDRKIGLDLELEVSGEGGLAKPAAGHGAVRAGLLARWLKALPDAPQSGATALATVGLGAVVLGLLLGYATARGVFWYDGDQPVNVVRVLGVFVVLQALTLVLFGVAALPGRGGFQEALRQLSPGRWAGWGVRFLPVETRDALGQVMGRGGAHQKMYGRVQKWQVLAWSQTLAMAFNVGALAGALQLIVGSDLAFGWSTTLAVEPSAMHRLTEILSAPWGWAWEAARPGVDLIRDTRTFRVESFEPAANATGFTRWWPFLVMCMGVYGLLPRMVTWAVARWRLRAAAVRGLAMTPGADDVLRRMARPRVQTQAA
ncbi:MAG: DUF2868 domain-containing protein, partial [Algisphaera sp.]